MNTLTVIFLLCSTTIPTVLTVESNITLVFRDLFDLARITNAIFLASQDVLDDPDNVMQIFCEFLQSKRSDFEKEMEIDVRGAIPVVEEIRRRTKEIMGKNIIKSRPKFVKKFNNHIGNGLKTVKKLLKQKELLDMSELLSATTSNQGAHFACDESVLASVVYFARQPEEEWFERRIVVKMELLRRLRDAIPELIECIRRFPSFSDTAHSSSLNVTVNKLYKLPELKSVVAGIATNPARMDRYLGEIGRMQQDLERMEPLLEGISPNGTSRTMKNMNTSCTTIREGPTRDFVKKLTNGYMNSVESDDTFSKWFEEKVAKGKSTEELERALRPIHKFVKEMYEVQAIKWEIFHWEGIGGHIYSFFADIITSTEAFESNMSAARISSFLEETKKTLTDCKPLLEPLNDTDFKRLDLAFWAANRIEGSLQQLVDAVNSFYRASNPTKYVESLEMFGRQVEEVVSSEQPDDIYKREQKDRHTHFRVALSIFKRLESVYAKHLELSAAIRQFEVEKFEADDFGLQKMVDDSQLSSYMDCLEAKRYDPVTVLKSARVVSSVVTMAKWKNYDDLLSLMSKVHQYQLKAKEIAEMAPKVSAKTKKLRKKSGSRLSKLNATASQSVHLGNAVEMLDSVVRANEGPGRERLLSTTRMNDNFYEMARQFPDEKLQQVWGTRQRAEEHIGRTLKGLDDFNAYCGTIAGKDVLGVKAAFSEAKKIPGIPVHRFTIRDFAVDLYNFNEYNSSFDALLDIASQQMDYADFRADLTGAEPALAALQTMFDDYFENTEKGGPVMHAGSASAFTIVAICVGVIVFILISICAGYGMTKSGRNRYTNAYLFYFGKPEEFEKRWRYSMFRDRTDGENALIDATREVNLENVQKALQKGAYINVYNKFGNTPLHTVARLGHADLVATLIKNGADRTLLNARNRTAEQMVPTEKEEKYAECARLFAKYRHKKFRVRVPEVFPVSSFHIYIEERTEDVVTSEFMERFRAITTEEPLATTTHCVVKVDAAGVLVTDDLNLLFWIFNGTIIVKEPWMVDCLKNEKLIEQDYKYLVQSVKFKGVVCENIIPSWTESKAKSTIPFLYGAHVVVVMEKCPNIETLSSIIIGNGGKVLDAFPEKTQFNHGSHPYLHAHLGPLFVIHDGKTPALQNLKGDPMFTVLTEDEFVLFMLRRQIKRDTSENPIPVVGDE